MTILGIETSCDETAIALIEGGKGMRGIKGIKGKEEFPKINILADKVSSQVKIHASFGGVVPGLAAREHLQNLPILLEGIKRNTRDKGDIGDKREMKGKIKNNKGKLEKIMEKVDLIAVTHGPGLMPCLLVGVAFAKALAYKYQKPIIGINHLEGHLLSSFIDSRLAIRDSRTLFPALGLIVSGGHTELVLIKKWGDYQLLGETLDDAAGEAFDKVARLLDLSYPGGPAIEKAAQKGNKETFNFPRPMANSRDYNFSFAGLKTAVLYKIRDIRDKGGTRDKGDIGGDMGIKEELSGELKADMAASFEQAVIDTLIKKTEKALEEFSIKTLITGGGVLANNSLRKGLEHLAKKKNLTLLIPKKRYCGDNASMIALAAYFNQDKAAIWQDISANPNLSFRK